jgi:hypothetical protein
MSLDPEDYSVLQSIAESLKRIKECQEEQMYKAESMLEIAQFNARREFLSLTTGPEGVRKQLRFEFEAVSSNLDTIIARVD